MIYSLENEMKKMKTMQTMNFAHSNQVRSHYYGDEIPEADSEFKL